VVQNTLLKSLEETRPGEIFILQAGGTQGIIPTILSRCQKIKLVYKAENQEKPFFTDQNLNLEAWWERKPKNLNELRVMMENWVNFDDLKNAEQKQKIIEKYQLIKKVNVNLDLFWINLYADLKIG
jgi:hypothetical protein